MITKSILKLRHLFLTIVFLELFLGGTGRLIEFSSFLTLRMCLFLVYICIIAFDLLRGKTLPKNVAVILLSFILLNLFSGLIGAINGAELSAIFEDIKPLLNTFLLAYLALSITSENDIKYLLGLIKISAIILSVFHLLLFAIFLIYSDLGILYSAISSAENNNTVFLFKGESGFINYTGDVYLCVGFIIWDQYHKNDPLKLICMLMIVVAIVLTGTRGLILALGAVYLIKWLMLKFNYASIAWVSFGAILVLGVYINIKDSIGDKVESDQTRYEQIAQVGEKVNPLSLVIGHGYGIGVEVRPVHMEISFLEVFHKQGLIGLSYYLLIWLVAYLAYKNSQRAKSMGLYMCLIFIFFVSATNPYVNHPLGITVWAISIICMVRMKDYEAHVEKV